MSAVLSSSGASQKNGAQQTERTSKKGEQPQNKTATNLRVLVAEDNKMNQKILRLLVEKAGHTCIIASDGKEAVARFEDSSPDVIFMVCSSLVGFVLFLLLTW